MNHPAALAPPPLVAADPPDSLDHWLAVGLLVMSFTWSLLPAGLSWDFASLGGNLEQGNWVVQLQWGSLFLVAGLLALRHFVRLQQVLLQLNPFLLALFLYCLMNSAWSILPLVTLKKVVQFGGLILLAVVLQITELRSLQWRRILLATLVAFQVLSLLMVLVRPDIAIEYTGIENGAWEGGAWRGITDMKNTYGIMTAFTVIVWVSLFFTPGSGIRWPSFLMLLGYCGLSLVMAKSTTSLLVTLLGVGCFVMFRWKFIDSEYVASRVVIGLVLLLLVYVQVLFVLNGRFPSWDEFFKPVAMLLGKSTDISGRFDIWDMVLQEIHRHWWQGVGFGAFWLGRGSASQFIIDRLYWVPYQSHNGYLDLLNELGLIGLALFVGFILRHLLTLYRLARYDPVEAAFHGTLLVVILVHNFTESSLFRGVNFLAILVIFSSVTVSIDLHRLEDQDRYSR